MQALHERDEGRARLRRRKTLKFLDAHNDDGVLAPHRHTLRAVLAGMAHHLAETGLGILELPASGRLPAAGCLACPCALCLLAQRSIPSQLVR